MSIASTVVKIPGYLIGEKLYNGSRTIVYRALREADSLPVVIKMLKSVYPSFSELLLFRNQYAVSKNLNSPLIIQTYSLEPYQNGYALVMEDFGGISLKVIAQRKAIQGMSVQEFLPLAISLCDSVDTLIRYQIIHKDIKPANILINPQTKEVKLTDFSIASLLPRETQAIQNANTLEGTLAYISPEQTGRMNRGIDYRSDFYSLGVTFYELLTGQLPFISDDPMELIHCHLAKTPLLIHEIMPEIPLVLSEIIHKLMAKNAEERYQSAFGIKHDLESCLHQLQATRNIVSFALGKRDISDRFTIPEKLYGREKEVEKLLEVFERVSSGSSEIVLVTGFSGIGKTVVVKEIHKPIVKRRGYFLVGKFDQFNRNIPFLGFVQAFRSLMGQLMAESDIQIQNWQTKILLALRDNAQVIIDVIPELERIIGKQPPVIELSGNAAENRFNLLFQRFLQIFTQKEHPLVIFLDDLQWADSASLKLIQLLMGDANQGYLLVVGAYRDNEVSSNHPLMSTLAAISKTGAVINTLTLKPLSQVKLNQLVADTLKCTQDLALSLSELIYRKTQGNPFFATQLLKSLHQDGLIEFNWQEKCWQCHVSQINQQTLTNDVVEFMTLELQRLPESTQHVLKLAACIGHQFDLQTLVTISECSEIDVASYLWEGLQSGLVLPQSDIYKFYQDSATETQLVISDGATPAPLGHRPTAKYKFLHDRVQQAAYSLIPEEQKQTTHYQIGQLLLEKTPPAIRQEHIFELVNQLNYGTALITQQSEREKLAQLNLMASRKAKSATAYQASRKYGNTGLYLLGENAWQHHYEMTLSLHNDLAELAMLCGDFDVMENLIEKVVVQASSLLDQINVYRVKIQAKFSQNKLVAAIEIGLQILEQLGVIFPQSPTITDVQESIQEISELIGDKKIGDFIDLPTLTDLKAMAIIQIARSIMTPAYLAGSLLFPLLTSLSVKLSLQYGNTAISPNSYVCYGIMICNFLQDVNLATQFSQLALDIILKFDAKAIKPEILMLFGAFIQHRQSHIQETLQLLSKSYEAALEVGNLEFVGTSGHCLCLNAFWCGQFLATVEQDTDTYYNGLVQVNQSITANYCQIYRQSALNLLGFAENPTILSGSAIQEDKLLPLLLSANDSFGLYYFYLYKLTLCFLFGEFELANNYAFETRKYLMGAAGTVGEPVFYFYDSLTALTQLHKSSIEEFPSLQRVGQNQTQLQQHWANHAPMNHQHKVDLVEAEKHRVSGNEYAAGDWYDRAISGAKENDYIQEAALANELAAKFYLNWGKEKIAAGYMQEAYYCYAKWGAKAKTDDLEKRYSHLLQPILLQHTLSLNSSETIVFRGTSSSTGITSSSSISEILDFTSILKATQTISSCIELDELVASLTKIILENSGAKKSILILPEEDTWQVRAITWINYQDDPQGQIQTIVDSESLDTCADVPRKMINYVKNTQETIVIDNCQTDIPGVIGEYMLEHQPKSVLCTPMINQGNLIGILYLENQITSEVFTSERLQVINLLSSQTAISLENASLYRKSQQALQDLQQAQLQIIQSEKMSALGNLVAGVGHEMNNPLGFIATSLQQAKPIISDIIEHLQLYQYNFTNPGEEILEHAAEIALDYSLEDLPKMIDSMLIASDRLKNISTSLRTFSRADQDYKVPFNIHEGINSTILILKHRLKANEQRPAIEVVTDYGKLPPIKCFPGQLNQVFMNILANAIDALEEANTTRSFAETASQPNSIIISTSVANKAVKIAISDNGKGMDEAVKKKIFDHLFTTKEVGKGTGLGLAIARQIVEDTHGGKIGCNSVLGVGTEFVIEIPIS